MKVLVLGAGGMLGHMVRQYLTERQYEVYYTTREKGNGYFFDAVENIEHIEGILAEVQPDFVVNCIGILNQMAEEHHSQAVIINSLLPHYLDELSEKYDYKLIHISTDCVFSGNDGAYDENSLPDAQSFYGRSKALGEVVNDKNVTFRTSIIGPDPNEKGIGLFKWFMSQEQEVNGYANVIWSGVTTLELAKIIEKSFQTDITGLYHAVNNKSISKYDLLLLFKKYYDKNIDVDRYEGYVNDKSLVNKRVDYDFDILDYEQMIEEMKEWTDSHKELYSNL